MGEPSLILLVLGLCGVVISTIVGLIRHDLRWICAAFAATPSFQLLWAGIGWRHTGVALLPLFLVPATTLGVIAVLGGRRRRAGRC